MINEWSGYPELTHTSEDKSVKSDLRQHESNFSLGSSPVYPSFLSQHHAWFPLNQEMCFDFALIFQVCCTFTPTWNHAAGPMGWLEAHVLTMCLRVTFQVLRHGVHSLAATSFANFATFWKGHLVLKPDLIFFGGGWVSPTFLHLSLSGWTHNDSRFLLCS